MAKNRLHPIPQPDGLPVIGNMLTVNPDTPLQDLMGICEEMGPIFWLDMMGKPMILVSGAGLTHELSDEKRFDKTVRGALRRLRAIGGDGLFTGDTKAPNWGKAHNILMPTFSQKSMHSYLPMMIDISEQLMQKWERLNSDDEVDIPHDMIALTLDTIGLCGFDYRFNSFYREGFHPFIDALTRTLEVSMLQKGLPFEDFTMRDRLKQLDKDIGYMNTLVDDIIRERRQTGGEQNDLLNFMLAGKDPVTGEGLSDENIRYQINTFLIAGHETTSGLLSFALYYLLKNPKIMKRAQTEVDAVLGHDVSIPPSMAQIGQLKYVRAVLDEALRLWPTAPAFSVSPYEDEVIGGKYKIKKGAFVSVMLLALHRDKSVWGDNPNEFNPDNFMNGAEQNLPPDAYKPFGNGQRACIGRQFALQESVLVLGMMLQRFQFFDHTNYDLKIKETLSLKPDGFKVKLRVRPEVVRGSGQKTADQSGVAAAPKQARRAKHGGKLLVLYGSNLGTSEGFARSVAQSGEVNGFETTLGTLNDFEDALPTDGGVIIISSSYNGSAPNNAANFLDWIEGAGAKAAKDVSYMVFGCGSRDWAATYQSVPRRLDEAMSAAGAARIMERGEADAREDLEGQFENWADNVCTSLGAALGLDVDFTDVVETTPLYTVEIAESVTANPVAHKAGTLPMRVTENRELQTHEKGSQTARSTRHIEIELPDGVTYEPGDHLCVVPVNNEALIQRAVKRFGFREDAHIRIHSHSDMRSPFPSGSTFSIRRLAEVFGELQAVASRKDVETLVRHIECPHSKPKLIALAAPAKDGEDLYRTEVFLKRKSVLDLLEEFPACDLPFAVYMEMIPWLTPRYYSISSSPSNDPSRCAITVGVVEGPARSGSGTYTGVCSNYLKDMPVGGRVQAVVKQPSTPFRLPADPSVPVIMIGPGTGVAPFRGFIQERRAQKEAGATLGESMLFFGCRHPDHDFLYEDELKQADKDGIIALHPAFSRLTSDRVYVQDLVRQQEPKIWKLIKEGAIIYVCGDGAAMEPDVKRALMNLYASENDVSFAQSQVWMEDMVRQGRYLLDVWAGN
ncbi:MAG: bifunctional cytochrome P450/NADPH--P450 reductase [Alphaproteobacteria bacterium]